MSYQNNRQVLKGSGINHGLTALVKGFNTLCQSLSVLILFISLFIGFNLGFTQNLKAETSSTNTITNTATASFSINGTAQTLSDSVQFTKDAVTPNSMTLLKQANKDTATIGDLITYALTIKNPNANTLQNISVQDSLPAGLVYQPASATLNGNPLNTNQVANSGNTLIFTIGNLPATTTWSINYQLKVTTDTVVGLATNKAIVTSDSVASNTSRATVTIKPKVRTPSTIEFLTIDDAGVPTVVPPTSYNDNQNGGRHWQEINSIRLADGSSVDLPTPLPLVEAQQYSDAEPVIIQVTDLDQNLDSTKLETIIVTVTIPGTNDKEVLLLTETAPDSGIFRGVILTTTDTTHVQNGVLTVKQGSRISVNYRDEADSTDVSADAALVVPNTRKLALHKTADKTHASIGELVRYTLTFDNTTQSTLPSIKIKDTLPLGFRYVEGSARLNQIKIGNTANANNTAQATGRSLVFTLNNVPAGASWSVDYATKITAGVQKGKAINQAEIVGSGIQSNLARASITIKDDLMRDKNILTGRVYIGCQTTADIDKETDKKDDVKVLKDARIYMETGRSVLSDEEGFWHMEGVDAGSHVLQLDVDSLKNEYEPIICRGNTRYSGDAQSRFVDLKAGTLWHVDFHVQQKADYQNTKNTKQNNNSNNPLQQYGSDYLKSATDEFEILWPKNNYVPAISSTKIMVKSAKQHSVEVFLNGKEISPLNYDGSQSNPDKTVIIRRWVGVDIDIKNRNNTLLAILKDKSGKEIARKTHNIHFSGEPASAKYLPKQSYLIADGKTVPVIALQVFDEDGFPMRANTHGYFTLEDSHYQVKTLDQDKDKLNLNESISGQYKYIIGRNGIARIKLNPTTQSGELKLRLKFNDKRSDVTRSSDRSSLSRASTSQSSINNDDVISVWLKPHLRKWIMVGIAEGTLGYDTLSGNMQSLKDLDKEDGFYKRGRVAFFAKGRVKGKYLLTVAYDTHKQKQKVGSQLGGNIDPDAWYTIYADNSNSQYDAPSSRKLYLKLEKDNFYTMFGDFHTGLSVTELAKYDRILNGIKTEYKGNRYSANAFISETSNKHQHQEIPGDGTSGLYYLNRGIVRNSEHVKIETRDRFHSDRIIETRTLTRYQDYEIDYDAGTLFFKFPINGRDQNFNPNIIVVDYDNEDEDNHKSITAGGRVAIKTLNKRLEVGLSALHAGRNKAKDDRLVATDATYSITPDTKIHAEIASSSTEASNHKSKQAYIIELEKQIDNMEARLYIKKHDENFGISSQASEDSIRKAGAEVRYKLNEKTNINAEVSHQINLSNKNERQLAQVDVEHRVNKQVAVSAGARHSREEIDGDKTNNNALLAGGKYTTKNGKITLRSDIEKNISSNNGSELSPDRAVVGVDVKLKHDITVFAEHETTDNGKETTHNNRVGVTKELWKGATGKSAYTQERTYQGQREYATLGLNQKVKVTDKISADFSIDTAKTIKDSRNMNIENERFNENEPAIQGSQRDDYTAFAVGLGANQEDWSWTTRFELRNGEVNDKINFTTGVIRHLDDGKNLSAKFSHNQSENNTGDYSNYTRLSLGSAWHPKNKNFVFLNRLDLVDEESNNANQYPSVFADFNNANANNTASGLERHTQKIIHNMHYNRKISEKTQISIHHGIKHVKDSIGGASSSSTVDTATVEMRHDINKKWDIGVLGGYLNDWDEKKVEALAGISVGVTPVDNTWLSMGYNFQGFYDKDFDKSDYKRQGPYVNFRYKFNQDSFDGDLPLRRKDKNKETSDTEAKNDI